MSNKVNRLKNKLAIEQQLRKNQAVLLKKLSEKKQLLNAIFKRVTELIIVTPSLNGKGPITMTIRGLIETIDPENNKVIFRTIPDVS